MKRKQKTLVRPFVVREGAKYTCFGDGLCCTDIHGIGPLTDRELVEIRRIDRDAAGWDDHHDDNMMRTAADGGCVFLLGDMRCSIHAKWGPEAKPEGCRRFPLGLVATPRGGRITTDHRCPCRTMGERPSLTAEEAEPSLLDRAGRPTADRRIQNIPLTKKKKISFDEWEVVEAGLLKRLQKGESPAKVLDAKPFPRLNGTSWKEQAHEFIDARDGTQFGIASAWMGDTILHLQHGKAPRSPLRPWSAAFDRAEARSKTTRSRRDVFADWIADEIWSLKWAEDNDFALARHELVTRLAIADNIANRIEKDGARVDRAAAESVTVVELVGESDYWEEVVDSIRY